MSAPEPMEIAGARLAIWRDAPSLDGLRTAALGRFACDDAARGAALLEAAAGRLAEEGFEALLGPMDGDTWAAYRLVVESDGRPPFLMEPSNPPHYPDAFERGGFGVVTRYFSAERSLEPREPVRPPPPGLRLRPFDPADAEDDLRAIHAVSLEAFAANPFFKPIGVERFLASYRPALGALDADLVLLAEDEEGALAGFLFGLPNLTEGASPRSAILKTYASQRKGLGSALASLFAARAADKGYRTAIHALMHEDNLSAQRSDRLGARVFRRYALWGRRL